MQKYIMSKIWRNEFWHRLIVEEITHGKTMEQTVLKFTVAKYSLGNFMSIDMLLTS